MYLSGTRGRGVGEGYPSRGGNGPLAVWTRFTPTFQSSGGDASLGAGTASASYAIIDGTLYVTGFFFFGPGVTVGTGFILLPFPPGFSDASVNSHAMPAATVDPGVSTEALVQMYASGTLGGTLGCFPSIYLIETNDSTSPPTVVEAFWDFDFSGLTSNDQLYFSYFLPLR